jgi:serine protease Do
MWRFAQNGRRTRRTAWVVGAVGVAALLSTGLLAAGSSRQTVHADSFAAVHEASRAALAPAPGGYADLVARVAPSIVTIRSERVVRPAALPFRDGPLQPFLREFGIEPQDVRPRREGSLGSGVIVSGDGYILTNNHVVAQSQRVKVELADRRAFDARVIGTDPPSDLAVVKIDARDLPALPVGDSDAVRVGDVVLAFGNPLGVGQTVTMGIVSAKGRATGLGDGSFEDFLQTDAPINQGNSGGALVDTSGQLVGINSQILSPSGGSIGIGFAIPSRMAESVMTQLVNHGAVSRGQLGVTVQGLTSDLAASLGLHDVSGALVSDVAKDSPAEKAGFERGDVIVSVDNRPVSDGNTLRNQIASTRPGTSLAIGIVRDGEQKTLHARLRELQTAKANVDDGSPSAEAGRLGLALQPLNPSDAKRLGVEATQGLLVSEVDPSGPAANAGIQPGDVILQVNRRPVADVGSLKEAVKASAGKPALFLLSRQGQSLFLTVEAPRA